GRPCLSPSSPRPSLRLFLLALRLLLRLLLVLLFVFLLGGLLFLSRRGLLRFRFRLGLRLRGFGLRRRRGRLFRLLCPRFRSGFLRLRRRLFLDLRLDQFVADEDVLAFDSERLLFRFVHFRFSAGLVPPERRGLIIADYGVLRRLELLR